MPRIKEIPSLEMLTLENIVDNVKCHAKMFENNKEEKLCFLYKTFHQQYSDMFLKALRGEQFPTSLNASEHQCIYDVLKSCLRFVFNEYVKNTTLRCRFCRRQVPENVTTHILSIAQTAKNIDLHYSHVNQDNFLENVSQWNCVLKLDLSLTACTDVMICSVWENLLQLQELDLHYCTHISDKSMQHLCRQHLGKESFYWCKENGLCCSFGKKLKILNIYKTPITEVGVKYALLHLRSLEHLESKLTVYCISEFNSLKLKTLSFPDLCSWEEMRGLLYVCPHLEHVEFFISPDILRELTLNPSNSIISMHWGISDESTIYSLEFEDFLVKYNNRLKKLAVTFVGLMFEIRYFIQILAKCKHLKELTAANAVITNEEGMDISELPHSIFPELEVLQIDNATVISSEAEALLLETLNRMKNLKILKIASEYIFQNFEAKVLNTLQTMHVCYIDMDDVNGVSLDNFVNCQNNLKELFFFGCPNSESFVRKYRDDIRKNNFLLNIRDETFASFYYLHWRCKGSNGASNDG